MLNYPGGTPFLVGDRLLIEHGRTPATIEHPIISDEEMASWGLEEPGLMLLSPSFGRVFWPFDVMDHDAPVFVSRGPKPSSES